MVSFDDLLAAWRPELLRLLGHDRLSSEHWEALATSIRIALDAEAGRTFRTEGQHNNAQSAMMKMLSDEQYAAFKAWCDYDEVMTGSYNQAAFLLGLAIGAGANEPRRASDQTSSVDFIAHRGRGRLLAAYRLPKGLTAEVRERVLRARIPVAAAPDAVDATAVPAKRPSMTRGW